MLQSIHAMLAIRFKSDVWMLTDAEAKRMDKAIKQVAKHYPVSVSQKQLDIGFAVYACAEIYGSRIVATIAQRKAAQQEDTTAQENVVQFHFPGMAPGA